MTFLPLSFISVASAAFYFLIALEEIPCTMLNESSDSGHLENDNF